MKKIAMTIILALAAISLASAATLQTAGNQERSKMGNSTLVDIVNANDVALNAEAANAVTNVTITSVAPVTNVVITSDAPVTNVVISSDAPVTNVVITSVAPVTNVAYTTLTFTNAIDGVTNVYTVIATVTPTSGSAPSLTLTKASAPSLTVTKGAAPSLTVTKGAAPSLTLQRR